MSDDDFNDDLDKTSVLQSDTFKVKLAQAGSAPPCLVMLVGPSNSVGRQWPIEDTDRILGRSSAAHVSVSDASISKAHAKLILDNGQVSIIDLESTNKTLLNGKQIDPLVPIKLTNNDQIKTGNVIFKFLEKGNIETLSVAQTFDRALIDPMTKINNKGAFQSKAAEWWSKSNLLGVPFSIITFDIDKFKAINDNPQFGHPGGDYVIIELTKVVREKLIRGEDFFARTGGEEFTLLLLGSPIEKCQEVAERIRATIENHHFEFNGVKIPVTVSLGVTSKREADGNWEEVFDRADKALYASKQGGRNRVTVA